MTAEEQALDIEQFKAQIDDEGDTNARFCLETTHKQATVLKQYADASADVSLVYSGLDLLELIGIPPGVQEGASIGGLDVVLKAVPYGTDTGHWYAIHTPTDAALDDPGATAPD